MHMVKEHILLLFPIHVILFLCSGEALFTTRIFSRILSSIYCINAFDRVFMVIILNIKFYISLIFNVLGFYFSFLLFYSNQHDTCNFFFRNDLYVTLNSGEFERGGKSVGKNIEVTVLAMDTEGQALQVGFFFLLL